MNVYDEKRKIGYFIVQECVKTLLKTNFLKLFFKQPQ